MRVGKIYRWESVSEPRFLRSIEYEKPESSQAVRQGAGEKPI